jgi:hypothetical protein
MESSHFCQDRQTRKADTSANYSDQENWLMKMQFGYTYDTATQHKTKAIGSNLPRRPTSAQETKDVNASLLDKLRSSTCSSTADGLQMKGLHFL